MTRDEYTKMVATAHDEYTKAVAAGKFPEQPHVSLPTNFRNEAGLIQNLMLRDVGCVTFIHSHAGAIRSNHYHKTDWHYMFICSGQMHYYWRPVGSNQPPIFDIFCAGEMMFTPPLIEHATFFPYDCDVITMSKNVRTHEEHEADLVRVKLIEIDSKRRLLGGTHSVRTIP